MIQLHESIAAVYPLQGIRADGSLVPSRQPTPEETSAAAAISGEWDFATGDWRPDSPRGLAAAKARRVAEIDARSAELIALGLPVNHGAPISLSLAAQMNLLNIATATSLGTLTLPQAVSRLDGTEYVIADAVDMRRIAALATTRIKSVLDAGRALRMRVLAAETRVDVDVIVDARE